MKASIPPSLRIFIFLDFALIIPAVTVELRLYGFPIASTHCPTFRLFELSNFKKGSLVSVILSNAKSLLESNPRILALYVLLSFKTTSTSSALFITCLLVTINPSSDIMTPDPLAIFSLAWLKNLFP